VTTIPYHCSRQEKSIWLDRGSTIRRQIGIPWIVLHHVPAKTGSGVSGEELEAAELLVFELQVAFGRLFDFSSVFARISICRGRHGYVEHGLLRSRHAHHFGLGIGISPTLLRVSGEVPETLVIQTLS
jgi:hypothetical protein